MTCDRLRELLIDLHHGELATRERAAVDAHLAGCEGCRAERRALARDLAVLAAAEHVPASRWTDVQVLAAVRRELERGDAVPRAAWSVHLRWGLVLAGAAIALLVSLAGLRGGGEAPSPVEAPARVATRGAPVAAPGPEAPALVLALEGHAVALDEGASHELVAKVAADLDEAWRQDLAEAGGTAQAWPGTLGGAGWSAPTGLELEDEEWDRLYEALAAELGEPDDDFRGRWGAPGEAASLGSRGATA